MTTRLNPIMLVCVMLVCVMPVGCDTLPGVASDESKDVFHATDEYVIRLRTPSDTVAPSEGQVDVMSGSDAGVPAVPDGESVSDLDQTVGCKVIGELKCGELIQMTNSGELTSQVMGWYPCQAVEGAAYAGSPELTYRFGAKEGTRVTVSETSNTSIDIHVLKDLSAGCGVNGESCLGGSGTEVTWDAQPNSSYLVVFDSRDGTVEEFHARVSCCTPKCASAACGYDGCGGSCGECEAGESCVEGACVGCTPSCEDVSCGDNGCGGSCGTCPDGGNCADGQCVEIALTGDCPVQAVLSCGASDIFTFEGKGLPNNIVTASCPEGPLTGPEMVYALDLEEDTVLSLTASGQNGPLTLLVLEDSGGDGCPSDACVASGQGELTMVVQGGQSYRVVIEASPDSKGDILLVADCCVPNCKPGSCGDDGCGGLCGSCGDDSVCVDGFCAVAPEPNCVVVASLTCGEQVSGQTYEGNGILYSYGCNPFDYAGSEATYLLDAPAGMTVVATVKVDDPSQDLDLFLLGSDASGCNPDQCLAWGASFLTAQIPLDGKVFLLVDSDLKNGVPYTLSVNCLMDAEL
jgi:hypothetical protein